MFSVAYVMIPQPFTSLQDELDRELAAFRRGGAQPIDACADASLRDRVLAAYERFHDHAAVGVAYHF